MTQLEAIGLLKENEDRYYRLAYVYLKNEHDAKDMVQDMVLRCLENLHGLRDDDKFLTWTQSILVNRCKSHLKKRRTILIDAPEAFAPFHAPDIDLERALAALKPKHREVIQLFYLLDYDQQSIAGILKIPVGTVKSRLSYGLKALRSHLEVE